MDKLDAVLKDLQADDEIYFNSVWRMHLNREVWQQLLSLESRDIVQDWFERIHSRTLNDSRAREINAAAKQSREYFTNADAADFSVRPLLTFYGVSSLGRALLLLMKRNGGEEGLKPSHGLETIGWGHALSRDIPKSLTSFRNLRIRTLAGLFTDFVANTRNLMTIHVQSSKVDWRLPYQVPATGLELSLDDLFSRLPDLESDYKVFGPSLKYVAIRSMSYKQDTGFVATVFAAEFQSFKQVYQDFGFNVRDDYDYSHIKADPAVFDAHPAMFTHKYVDKDFGSIPSLYICEPFENGARFSQLAMIYMVAYAFGMLVRYYPTHWIALIQGDHGDAIWPTMNRAQRMVETVFPEMVAEMIDDLLIQAPTKLRPNA